MKKLLFFVIFCFSLIPFSTYAQVDHDDCENSIFLGEAPSCPTDIFTSIGATTSTISSIPEFEIPSCWSNVGNDVWASFTVPADGSYVDFQLSVNGASDGPNGQAMIQPQLALYRGECMEDGLVELACELGAIGSESVQINVEGLTPGNEYFLRISTYSATATPNDGDFKVCVDTIPVSMIEASASDYVLCNSQEFTELTATSTSEDIGLISWTPANSVSSPNAATTLAFPFQTTTYNVTAFVLGENMVSNPGFEDGDTGFTSGYNSVEGDLNGLCEGCYNINTMTPSLWTQCGPLDNNMMIMNGAPQANVDIWCQEVNVIPNTDYFFSTQVQTINSPVPQLQFRVDGNLIGTPFFGGWACNWQQYFETVNSGNNSTLEICIVNQSTAGGGNDFALDNINFSTYTESQDSVTIEVSNLSAQANMVSPDNCLASCEGSAEVTASGGIGELSYEWQDGQTTSIATGLCAGTYSVTITDEADCSVIQQVEVGQTLFEISVVSLVSPCDVSTIGSAEVSIFGGVEPYDIEWDNGETTAIAENLSAGTHDVTVTDSQGCEAVGEVEIVLSPDGFNVSITSSSDSICPGETITLTAATGNSDEYTWSNEATGSEITVSPIATSYYEVTAKRTGNNIIDNGDFSAGNTSFNSQYIDAIGTGIGGAWGPLSLEGTYAVTNNPALVHTNFASCSDHTSGSGNMIVVNGSGTPNLEVWCQTVTVDPTLTYQFSSWVTSVIASNPAVLQFSINDELLGDPFEATTTTCEWTNFFEIWEANGSTTAEICIVNQNTGGSGNDFALDDIELVPVCITTTGITIHVDNLEAEIDNIQHLSCVSELGQATAIPDDGWGPFTFLWSNGETTATASSLETGTHTVTITDDFGCTAEANVNIEPAGFTVVDEFTINNLACGPIVDGEVTIIQGSIEAFPGAGEAPFSYSIDGGSTFQDAALFENLAAGTYDFVLTDANECTYETTLEILDVNYPEVTIVSSAGFDFCDNTSLDLSIETTGEIESISWSNNSTESQITVSESGLYSVTVLNDENCPASDEVEIDDCTTYEIPNVFTPNGDDINDIFKVYSAGGVIVKEMKIYNRWGNLVHNDTQAWDGEYKGSPHQSDVLIYIIVLETNDGEIVEHGEVTLLR